MADDKKEQMKAQIREAADMLLNVLHQPSLSIGIDLDGCIDEAPDFFRSLSQCWPGEVFVITYRTDQEKARQDVERFGINYTEIILVSSFEQKAEEITKRNIFVYFDDQDEILMHIPESVNVFKIRNGGNFDFDQKKWLYSEQTGRTL
jgi:hypothetical protein